MWSLGVFSQDKKIQVESCSTSTDCVQGLVCRTGKCLRSPVSLFFGDTCVDNTECNVYLWSEYKQCLNKPNLDFISSLHCGYKDDFQGYYSFDDPQGFAYNSFCRNVGHDSSRYKACIVKVLVLINMLNLVNQ